MQKNELPQYDQLWENCRSGAIKYIHSLEQDSPWLFTVSDAARQPIAIASATAILTLSFLEAIDEIPQDIKQRWLDYLLSFQKDDGLCEDLVDMANETQGYPYWALRAHRTRHITWAIEALGGRLRHPMVFVEPYTKPNCIADWFERMWDENADRIWAMSNWVMDMGVLLDLQYRHFNDDSARLAVESLIEALNEKQDKTTGYWLKTGTDLRCAMAGAMHFYPLYWAYGRSINYFAQAVETTLTLQQPDGLFAFESGAGGCQCLDYDAMLILANGHFKLGDLRNKIAAAAGKVLSAIMVNHNEDGSFDDSQTDETRYWTTKAAVYKANGGSIWDTYARLMTIAMCIEIVTGKPPKFMRSEHHLFEIFHAGYGWRRGSSK